MPTNSTPNLVLDHIAVAARSLDEGIEHVREALGVDVPFGGNHPAMGTHNRLMALGPNLFLEVIAIDPNAPKPNRARWYGLDTFDKPPQLGTWVLATSNIRATLAEFPSSVGHAVPIKRGAQSWLISVPDDGTMTLDGAFPTIIEWPNGSPAQHMTDLGCRFVSLTIEHPEADVIKTHLAKNFADSRVIFRSEPKKAMHAKIETPNGIRTLS